MMGVNGTREAARPRRARWRRFLPLLVLAAALILFFALGLNRFISFDALRDHREALLESVDDRSVRTSLLFFLIYAGAVAISIPGAVVLTLLGGFLFGVVWGSLLVAFAATTGATLIFLAARSALGDVLRRRAGGWLARLEQGFRDHAVSYLLTLRLVPLVPFWLVNIVPAFFGMGLVPYALTTFFGILPGTIVYVSVGAGLGATLDRGDPPDLGLIFRPEIFGPLLGLAALALVPVAYKKLRRRKAER